ncbi:hypothetical protein GTQ40_15580 [Flavobacteriaceae bacterium R38]|nr:hypothetical protein [Flavobacteriaceae bacterium R38]
MNVKRLLFILLYFFSGILYCQVGIGTITPHSSSVLDISSSDKGILIPRMTQVQKDDISAPANGLMVYQTDNTPGFYFYNGSSWMPLSTSASGDNLGNHTATEAFDMANHSINNIATMSLMSTNATTFSFNRFDGASTTNDQLRVTANGSPVFGILGDGRVNTTGNILMVNNATVDRVDVSEMIGISGSHLGNFTGTVLADNISIKEALQILENAVMSLEATAATAVNNENIDLNVSDVLPKFSVHSSEKTSVLSEEKNIISFKNIEFDTRTGYSLNDNGYQIPVDGTYFIQFNCQMGAMQKSVDNNFISIMRNGKEISRSPVVINDTEGVGTVSAFNTYKKGDVIQVSIFLTNKPQVVNPGDYSVSFSGFQVK